MTFHLLIAEPAPRTRGQQAQYKIIHQTAIEARRALNALDLAPGDPRYVAAKAEMDRTAAELANFPSPVFHLSDPVMVSFTIAGQLLGLCHDYGSHPEWPVQPEELTNGEIDIARNPDEYPGRTPTPEALAYEQALDNVRRWDGNGEGHGIARHKFASDDDWFVTAREIAAGLAAYRTHDEPEVTRILEAFRISTHMWALWIDFLKRASEQGGFMVR